MNITERQELAQRLVPELKQLQEDLTRGRANEGLNRALVQRYNRACAAWGRPTLTAPLECQFKQELNDFLTDVKMIAQQPLPALCPSHPR